MRSNSKVLAPLIHATTLDELFHIGDHTWPPLMMGKILERFKNTQVARKFPAMKFIKQLLLQADQLGYDQLITASTRGVVQQSQAMNIQELKSGIRTSCLCMQVLYFRIRRSFLPLQYLPQPARFKNKCRQSCSTINTEPKQIGIELQLKHSQGVFHTLKLDTNIDTL